MENPKMNPVVWFEIYVDDMDRATQFYEIVLQVQLTDLTDPTETSMQMRAFPSSEDMTNYGTGGALVKMDGAKVGAGGTMVYFACEDCAVEESRVESAGGKVCQPKMAIGEHGFCSVVSDTEGNVFGLHSMS